MRLTAGERAFLRRRRQGKTLKDVGSTSFNIVWKWEHDLIAPPTAYSLPLRLTKAERCIIARRRAKMSLKVLAGATGFTVQQIQLMEQGHLPPEPLLTWWRARGAA